MKAARPRGRPPVQLPDCDVNPFNLRTTALFARRILLRCTLLFLLLLPPVLASGCFGAKQTVRTDASEPGPDLAFAPEQIHSPSGDMAARLPKDWVTIDAEQLESPQVFAIACDPAYTLSVIFSETPADNAARSILARDGLQGLVDASFQRHVKRSRGRAEMTGETEEFAIGRRRFAAYTYTTDSMLTLTRVAVFYTNAHVYECALTHLTFNSPDLAGARAFRGIHQLILGSIEW